MLKDGKNVFMSLLDCGGGKLAIPMRRSTDSGIMVSGGFSLLWCTFADRGRVKSHCRCIFVWRLAMWSWFSPRKQRWRGARLSSVLDRFPDSVRGQDSNRTCTYLRPPPPPRKAWILFRNDPYSGMHMWAILCWVWWWMSEVKFRTGTRSNRRQKMAKKIAGDKNGQYCVTGARRQASEGASWIQLGVIE